MLYRLLEKHRLIIAAALLGALITGFYSFVLAKPVYQATSKLYVLSSQDSAINLTDLQIGAQLTTDYEEALKTWEVRDRVIRNLNLDYTYTQLGSMVSVSVASSSRILNITTSSADPQEALDIANEYARVAQDYISEVMITDKPTVLSQALLPTVPVRPQKSRSVILGFLLGAIIASIIIIIIYLLDDKIHTAEDIQRYVGIPTLAVVPVEKEVPRQGRERA